MKKKLTMVLIGVMAFASTVPAMAQGGRGRHENYHNVCVCERACSECNSALEQGVCTQCGADNRLYKNAGKAMGNGGRHFGCNK